MTSSRRTWCSRINRGNKSKLWTSGQPVLITSQGLSMFNRGSTDAQRSWWGYLTTVRLTCGHSVVYFVSWPQVDPSSPLMTRTSFLSMSKCGLGCPHSAWYNHALNADNFSTLRIDWSDHAGPDCRSTLVREVSQSKTRSTVSTMQTLSISLR